MSVAPVTAPTPVDEVTAAAIESSAAEMTATDKATMSAPNLYDVAWLAGSSIHGRWRNDRSTCSGRKRKKAAGDHASSQHTLHHWVTSSWARVSPPQRWLMMPFVAGASKSKHHATLDFLGP
jgi:hypothetical protein